MTKPKTHVWLFCPRCGETTPIEPPTVVVIAPDSEVRCVKCGTVWRIEELIEAERDHD